MQRKNKEKDLLKKAMENINNRLHDKKEVKEPYRPKHQPVWETNFTPNKSIEEIREYLTKNDLPSWEVDELRNKIDSMMNPVPYNTDTHIDHKDEDEIQINFHDNTESMYKFKDRMVKCLIDDIKKQNFQYNKEEFEDNLLKQFQELNKHKQVSTDNHMSSYMQKQIDRDLEAVQNGLIKDAVEQTNRSIVEKACHTMDMDNTGRRTMQKTEDPHTENPLNNPMEQLKQHSMETLEKLSREPKSMYDHSNVRSHNIGESDYSKHRIQPWDIWEEYNLNPWDADIVKRTIRTKREPGKTPEESRIMDYEKIIHVAQERIRQIRTNGHV